MSNRFFKPAIILVLLASSAITAGLTFGQESKPKEIDEKSYMPVVIDKDFETIHKDDAAQKEQVLKQQRQLLEERYDLRDGPAEAMASGGRKALQEGVRVKLPQGVTWQQLAEMTPEEIKSKNIFPMGFRPLPHVKHEIGGMVFPELQIKAMLDFEKRDLARFDVAFDLPVHLMPDFPPPIYLTSRPDLGDVSQGKVLSIKNYYQLFHGKLSPVQLEGMRLLLTPFPQQQFNATEDRKVLEPSLGVTCLDCHVNGHTNAAFHQNPDTRPQQSRFRLDTVSLRGMYNQQIHGAKRSLRSVEDFTEFEQRTAYFDGDHVIAAKKGVHLPDRSSQVSMMAQMQNLFDFPPAPKLDEFGRLKPEMASKQELMGQKVFFGNGRCAECHNAPFYLDNKMHDLHLGRFYETKVIANQRNIPDGPIKTFTLRGIKDSPPFHHDGRLLTLDDTVEFYNLVLSLKLTDDEKKALVAFLRCL